MKHRVLSLHLPWALLCVARDPQTNEAYKIHETRGRNCHVRGPILIHAAKKWDKGLLDICMAEPFRSVLFEIATTSHIMPVHIGNADIEKDAEYLISVLVKILFGKIIGQVNFDYCQKVVFNYGKCASIAHPELPGLRMINDEDYAFGNYDISKGPRYAIGMSNAKILAEPMPFKGSQGFFFYETDKELIFK